MDGRGNTDRKGGKEKEFTEIQKLKEDNKKLRAQISKLRNLVKNIDANHYEFVNDLMSSDRFNPKTKETKKQLRQKIEEQWKCHECDDGIMRLVVMHRVGEPWYLRKCDCCLHKTKLKKYNEEITGA